jgi:hypothetical protein
VKLLATDAAAAYVPLPGWLAVTVQVPAETSVSVAPLTVQTDCGDDTKPTARPELALAVRVTVPEPITWLPGEVNVTVCGAAAKVMLLDTEGAAAYVPLPAWLAVTLHVPVDTSVSVLPLTVHTDGVVEAKPTAKPEVAVAVRVTEPAVSNWLPGEVKVMVCERCATVKLLATDVAAAYVALPAWLAVTVQVPAETSVSVLPLTVHTALVLEAKPTARPEVAVAERLTVPAPSTWLPGEVKVIVCGVAATVMLLVTEGAAA